MLPYGVPFESLYFLYLTLSELFWFQIPYGESAFFVALDFLSPVVGATVMLPMGSHLSLFSFYILPQLSFLTSNSLWRIRLFFACDFLSPAAGATEMLPTGSHLSLFLFYILPQLIFLTSNSLWRIGLFFARDFLYWRMGRTDGWMDGRSVHFFFFAHILKTTW